MTKLFSVNTEKELNDLEQSLIPIVQKWLQKHPSYQCNMQKTHDGGLFQILITCNDISNVHSRLN